MNNTSRFFAGLLAGCASAVMIALVATLLTRNLWPAYAAAEPGKAYSNAMLAVRLSVGAICTIGGAWVTSSIAKDTGRAANCLGVTFLALSLPDHLYRVWAEYPAWYHAVYLSYLVPLAALTRGLHSYYHRLDAHRVHHAVKSAKQSPT